MASETHEGHRFVEVTYEYQTKKEIIEKDSEELEKNICPKYEEIAHDLENQLANLDGGYEKITSEISNQGEEWHREIEIIINQMKSEINEIKMKHKYILQKHLDEINEIESLMKKSLLNLKELAKSTEVSSTIEYSSKIREFSKLPPKLQVLLPTFIPNPKDRGKLCSMFGQFTTLFTATVENPLSLNQPSISVRELLDKSQLVTKIQTGYTNLRSVACLNDEQIWTSGLTNDIKCLNIRGSLVQAIHTKSGKCPNDIAVDSDGDILYSDGTTRTVNKVKNGRTHEIIRLQGWKPNNLCVSSTGDLLVTMRKDDYSESKVLFVQFLKKPSQQLYSLHGNKLDLLPIKDGDRGITTDSRSRILTANSDNHCIHIFDQIGQFLCYIDTLLKIKSPKKDTKQEQSEHDFYNN
eukprot:XP_019920656.1 PREDICTED: uncharacterized protein LOC109617977 [Crassostrea gigas]